jgi:hypothetical protein
MQFCADQAFGLFGRWSVEKVLEVSTQNRDGRLPVAAHAFRE